MAMLYCKSFLQFYVAILLFITFIVYLISDQAAKWFEINMKNERQLCLFLLAYSILNHDICFLSRKKCEVNKQGNQYSRNYDLCFIENGDHGSVQPVTTIIMWKGPSYTVGAQDTPLTIRINFILNIINVSVS